MSSKLRLSLSLHVSMAGPRDGCNAFARTRPTSLPLRAHWGEASQPRARPGTTYIVLSQGGSATDWAHIIQSLMASDFIPLLMRKRFEVRGESQNRRASDATRRAARLPASSARTKQNKTQGKRGSGKWGSHTHPHEQLQLSGPQLTGHQLTEEAARLHPSLCSGLYLQRRTEHSVTLETANKGSGQSCKNPARSLRGGWG